jgi:ADP-ribose pyrophosphatase
MANVLSSRRAYERGWFRVDEDRVELPGKGEVDLVIVRHPGAAAVVPFLSPNEVLLLRQYRHAAEGVLWEVPAGKLDPGEDPALCAARELEEEAGHRARRIESLGWIWTTPGFTDERIHLFAAFELEPAMQKLDADEVIEVVRTPLAEAIAKVWRGELRDAKSAMALLHAAHRLGRLA